MVGDSPDIVGEGPISDLGDLEGWWDNHAIIAWSFVLFGCILLNVTLLLAFLVRPSLRTISNRFVMNLTVSNLLVCIIMSPLLIMDTTSATSIIDSPSIRSICATSEGAMAIVTTSSVLSVLLIAVDQYFAVVDPLRYRTRVDKLKSGILISSIWLISIIFGFLAFFNPNPQSFWLSCIPRNKTCFSNTTDALFVESTVITLLENETSELNVSQTPELVETVESVRFDDDIDLIENTTVILDTLVAGTVTYGLVYAIIYSIFAYLIPFVAVCWIYISIYVAAHRNSVRARRTGSRPILSSASFTEEQMCTSKIQRFQSDTIEDFRKLPKISSLSSIDETSETMQPTGQLSRRRSFSSSLEIQMPPSLVEDNPTSGIVFTVGSQMLEVSQSMNNAENCRNDILYNNCDTDIDAAGKNRDKDFVSEQLGSSSEELKDHDRTSKGWILDDSSDSEEESRFECFENLQNSLEQFDSPIVRHYPAKLLKESLGKTVEDEERSIGNGSNQNEATIGTIALDKVVDQREGRSLQVADVDSQSPSQGDLGISATSPSEARPIRRSTMFVTKDILSNAYDNRSSCNKTDNGNAATESSTCLLTPIVTITPAAPGKNDSLHRVSSVRSTSSYINNLKDRISNGSIFRHREETRAGRISALVIVMGLICWSPYVILLVLKNLPRSTDQHLPHKYDVLASSLLILAAYISPLLFGYRSKRVKRELRRFFCFRKELSYKNNRSLMAKKVLKRRHSSTPSNFEMDHKYNIFSCMYGKPRWPKDKVQFVQVPDTALAVETCRSSFSSGASTQISTTSTEEC